MKQLLVFLGLCLGASNMAFPCDDEITDEPVPRSGKRIAAFASLDDLLETFITEHEAPGVSVAVSRDGRVAYARSFGWADRNARQPVKPESLFRIASISKPITAVAILQLQEAGLLNIDDPAFAHLPSDLQLPVEGPPDPLGNVTIRHLLQHRGGWDRDASFDAMFRAVEIAQQLGVRPPAGSRDVIRFMAGVPLDFAPGSKYAYSNYGYCLLGRIIEAKSGMTYERYVQRRVLEPLGIRSMRIGRTLWQHRHPLEVRYHERPDRAGEKLEGRSVFSDTLGEPVPRAYGDWHFEAMDSHGAWLASATDLVRFASAFDDPDHCPLLNAESVHEMFAIANDSEQIAPNVWYSLGWLVRRLESDPSDNSQPDNSQKEQPSTGHSQDPPRRNAWHTGSLPGTSTLLVRRHDGLSWAVLFNGREAADGQHLARKIDPLLHQAIDKVDWTSEELQLRDETK